MLKLHLGPKRLRQVLSVVVVLLLRVVLCCWLLSVVVGCCCLFVVVLWRESECCQAARVAAVPSLDVFVIHLHERRRVFVDWAGPLVLPTCLSRSLSLSIPSGNDAIAL
jgi:hypothetical protein